VNTDQLSKNFAARSQILDESTAALTGILKMPSDPSSRPFDRVLVAGHSLGVIVAYDTINEMLNHARAAKQSSNLQPTDLIRLRGLVTFGSPLNKIFYFFRQQVDARLALRRQTIDLLHGLRIRDVLKGRAGNPRFEVNHDPRWTAAEHSLECGFLWINAYAFFNPISGKLGFYDLGDQLSRNPSSPANTDVNQMRFHYGRPFLAHLQYWEDPKFYEFIRDRLL